MPDLTGQVAVITGGALGIGGGTARRLAADGASVLIADINGEAAEQNAARIREAGGTAEAIVADVSKSADIRRAIDTAVERWGKLTILVNNAFGVAAMAKGTALEVEEDDWDRGFAVLVKALYIGAKHAVPLMQAAGGGSIINISSVHGLLAAPRALVYDTGKAAVIGLTRQLAVDFGPLGIRVNAICPGHIVTEAMEQRWEKNPRGLDFFNEQYPVRRTGTPADIAAAIAFLCSQDASFITGQALAVDGGLTIQLQEDLGVHLGRWAQENPDTKFTQ
ncbi:MAG TPA: SDR family oxidoreductase [Thermomicrobiales bacterium]|jgi:NAD(P)-dependent dehydrogenase (short-subunit alcohol dehydrogenase family)